MSITLRNNNLQKRGKQMHKLLKDILTKLKVINKKLSDSEGTEEREESTNYSDEAKKLYTDVELLAASFLKQAELLINQFEETNYSNHEKEKLFRMMALDFSKNSDERVKKNLVKYEFTRIIVEVLGNHICN